MSKIKLTAICFASVQTKHMRLLLESIDLYVPNDVEVYFNLTGQYFSLINMTRTVHQYEHTANNYGDAYNFIVKQAFNDHDHIIVCNDDTVFTPTTYEELNQDYNYLHETRGSDKVGWVGCLTNYAIGIQNIRRDIQLDNVQGQVNFSQIQNEREGHIVQTSFIAPICGAISKDNWIDYLPINYFSDNLQCYEMSARGKEHYVSTAYIHHAGSQTISNATDETNKAMQILEADYPHYYDVLRNQMM